MTSYSDEYIDFWGGVFIDNKLRDIGITFEFFLLDPVACLESRYTGIDLVDHYPLLAQQVVVEHRLQMDALDKETEALLEMGSGDIEQHGDRLIQPFYHYAKSKKWKINTRHHA